MVKHYNIPIFVPHLGCPHDCVFCNQRKITGIDEAIEISAVKDKINTFLNTITQKSEEKHIEIAFFGGSFTGIPYELQIEYLDLAYTYKKAGLIDGIRLSTRPDYIDKPILEYLLKYGVTTIELGVQSLDDLVLKAAHRGHTLGDVKRACKLIRQTTIQLGLQMMIGLPDDTEKKALETARMIHQLGPDCVRIYPTLVIKDTELEDLYKKGLYKALTVEEAVLTTAKIYSYFKSKDIPVIRIGLQPTEELNNGALIAGPYHPAFRQLVESEMYHMLLSEILSELNPEVDVVIFINSNQISNIVGQGRKNLLDFEKKYKLSKIKIFSKTLEKDVLELVVDGCVYQIKLDFHLKDKYEIMKR